MIISVLSGKGGTGKTTIATNLAVLMSNSRYVDCDVEEPNGFIFLKPQVKKQIDVEVMIPEINMDKCSGCGKCTQFCYFNALALVKNTPVVFPELCHGCEGCAIICPEQAVDKGNKIVGKVEVGYRDGMECIRGVLNVGEPAGVPILREIYKLIKDDKVSMVDCPPGSSCSVINSITDSDFALLVTEPTVFGLHDLKIAAQLVKQLKIPAGIIINRSGEKDNMIEEYCKDEDIPLLGKIPFDRSAAEVYSRGELLVDSEKFRGYFQDILDNVKGVI